MGLLSRVSRMLTNLITGLIVLSIFPAHAQNAERDPAAGEIVQRANGEPVGYWQKSNTCNKATNVCGLTLINSNTGEVAVYAGQIAGAFSRTGVGAEIRRLGLATTLGRKTD